MNIPNHISQLIKKELEDELSPEERSILNNWYEGLEVGNEKVLDTRKEENLKALMSKIKPQRHARIDYNWIGWAAAFFVVFLGIFEIYNLNKTEVTVEEKLVEERFEKFINPRGVRRKLTLADGSVIFLNGGSKVEVSKQFSANRKVYLEGEAFFEVVKDPENPFVVVTDGLETSVLGTAFTVSAYKGKPQTVAVKEGKVKVIEAAGDDGNEDNFLIANEQLTYKTDTGLGNKIKINPDVKFAWVNGKIIFNQTPINEVFITLSNWYGLESVELSDKNMKCLVTGSYTRMTLEDIMESIKYATGIAYEINGKHLKVRKGNC
ncbi:FecR domain-containing protein [uncultured Cyclobacterium sp.]|uniref:FecR family protein n=1 Tax=uncultured Cyclobacterium sp. TaxID=453820 RepID=UPI0030EB6678|tara:strand:+ start:528641 stop:529603 length:963 start_codon:yes stop_codon:yes gene_type:complete